MRNWDDYRLILALDRCGTLRGAADHLGINHSTVSRRLAMLDDEHGQPVFERHADGYRPTAFGQNLIESAHVIEQASLAGERNGRAANAELSGRITLSIPEAIGQFLLLDALMEFGERHPRIELVVKSSYDMVDLDRSEADVVVRGTEEPPDHLVGRRLFPHYLAQYCRHDYLKRTAPEDRRWIISGRQGPAPEWIRTSSFPDVKVGMTITDHTLRHQAMVAGKAMGLNPCFMSDQEPMLVRVPGTTLIRQPHLWVLTHPALKETPRIRALMAHVAEALIAQRGLIAGEWASSEQDQELA